MGRKRIMKYDVVISFAHQDEEIALALNEALKKKRLDTYCYQKVNQFGLNLEKITKDVYYSGANYALVILSKNYVKNYWTKREFKMLLKAERRKRINAIYFVRIDQSRLYGITGKEVYEDWKDNPREIASKIKSSMINPRGNVFNIKFILFILSVLLLIILHCYYSGVI